MPSPFASVGATLAENGYSAIPIKPDGKAPGQYGADGWRLMSGWSEWCRARPSEHRVRGWSRWPDAGVGIACGRGILAFDIDRDDLVVPILAALPPVIVAKRGRKGLTAFYRGDTTAIRSRGFKIDGLGVMDLISDGKQTVIPPSIHPTSGEPYEWTTERTLLDTMPAELAEVTIEHVEAVIAVLQGFGYAEERKEYLKAEPAAPGARWRSGVGYGEVNERALANLHAWAPALGLPKLIRSRDGYRAVADWRPSSSGKAGSRRARNLSIHPGGIVDFGDGDRGYTPIALVGAALRFPPGDHARAAAWLGERLGLDPLLIGPAEPGEPLVCASHTLDAAAPRAIPPTYYDTSIPLAEAEAEVARHVSHFFEREAPAYKGARAVYEMEHPEKPLMLPPVVPAVALRIEAGVGKSEAAIRAILTAVRQGLAIVYSVPTIVLADDIADRLARIGVTARVWRGRGQSDPEFPGEQMCRDPAAVDDARKAGVRSVAGAICQKKRKGAEPLRCAFFDRCGHVRQQRATPTVWIITHAMLFRKKPAAIPIPDALVIDEEFASGALPSKATGLAIDAIERAPLPRDANDMATLGQARRALVAALREAADGYFRRPDLEAAGLTSARARDAVKLEWSRYVEPDIVPGLPARERGRRANHVAGQNAEIKALAGLWREIADFLDGDAAESGRLKLAQGEGGARIVRRWSLKTVHHDWRTATLILDATAPPTELLSIALGMPVEMRALIRATWHTAGHVRQIIGAPVSSNALGANGQGGGDRAIADLARFVALRAAEVYPAKVGVVLQKGAQERLMAHPLPSNVEIKHFGALAGLDLWCGFGGVIVIGRTAPARGSMEADAGVLTGSPVAETDSPFAKGAILRRNGSTIAVSMIRLANPIAEARRWQVCEGNLIQAIGRIRPLRLGGREDFFVDIICDVPLPIIVDEVAQWEAAKPGHWAKMAAQGVIFASASDAEAIFGLSRKEARTLVEGATVALTPKRESPIGVGATVSIRRATVKRRGRFAQTEIILLPNAPQDHTSLRLGPLKPLGRCELKIEGEPPRACPFEAAGRYAATASPLAQIGAWIVGKARAFETLVATVRAADSGR